VSLRRRRLDRTIRCELAKAAGPEPPNQDRVDERVDHDHQRAEHELRRARELSGVDQRQQIALDEPARVPDLSAAAPQLVLERCERADPSAELDQSAPECRWKVEPHDARPAQREQSTGDDEADEERVDDDDGVGEKAVGHVRDGTPWQLA
jgi:hypothetical protein